MKRRDFLKIMGGAGVTIPLIDLGLSKLFATPATAEEEFPKGFGLEKWVNSVCQQCPGGCGIRARLVDGRLVKIEGNPYHPINRGKICPNGHAGLQVVYNPDRIKGPLKRSGPRGSGSWESISWDDAIEMVAKNLRDLRGRGEPHTVVFLSDMDRGLMKRLIKNFMEVYGSPNLICPYDPLNEQLPYYLSQGISKSIGYDLKNTSYLLSFGSNILETGWSPVWFMGMYGHMRQGRPGVRAKIVQVESRNSFTAAKADEWIPVNPGTEGALALGIAYILIKEELYDRDFVKNYTFGFNDWIDRDGVKHLGYKNMVLQDYSVDFVSSETGVPVETIIRLAREVSSNKPSVVMGKFRVSENSNGVYNNFAIHSLNALIGSIDVPGGVILQREIPYTPWPDFKKDVISLKGLSNPMIDVSISDNLPLSRNRGGSLADIIINESPYRVNCLLLYNVNPLFTFSDSRKVYSALEKIPFIVSFSPFMDESSSMADLILPDHTYLEKWQDDPTPPLIGIQATLSLRQPVIPPIYNTMHTGDVLIRMAKSIDRKFSKAFPWKDFRELLKFSLRGVFESGTGSIISGTFEESWIKFLEERGWRYPAYTSFNEFWEEMREKGGWWDPSYHYREWQRVFNTPSGKFEFYSLNLKKRFNEVMIGNSNKKNSIKKIQLKAIKKRLNITVDGDRIYLPHYEKPHFMGSRKDYPYILLPYCLITMRNGSGANQPLLQEFIGIHLNRKWESWVEINPETAKKLGISDNELIWIESPVGNLKVKAKIYSGTMPDVISIPFGLGHTEYGRYARNRGINPNRILVISSDYLSGQESKFSTRVNINKV
ncbi:MAG: molybdopterin-dependent oxidoreductase [Fidelibacterota bacterium]